MPTRRIISDRQRREGKNAIEVIQQSARIRKALIEQGRTSAADKVDAIAQRYQKNIMSSPNVKPYLDKWSAAINNHNLRAMERNQNKMLDARVDKQTYMAKAKGGKG